MICLDIPMPQNCGDCPCARIFDSCRCMVVNLVFDKYPLDKRMDWCPIIEMKVDYNRIVSQVKSRIPKDVYESARNEVLDSGNQGIWTMCLVAIEKLAEFWKDEHEE